jgi:hypothetical protein
VEAATPAPTEVILEARGRRSIVPRLPAPSPRLVTGQGLDRLVRDHLDGLRAGERLVVAFAIPSRHDTFEFRLRLAPGQPSDASVQVRLEAASWVLRLLAPSMDVEYDRATRRLLRYRGPSNLPDEGDEHPEVEITYAYASGGAAEATRGSP